MGMMGAYKGHNYSVIKWISRGEIAKDGKMEGGGAAKARNNYYIRSLGCERFIYSEKKIDFHRSDDGDALASPRRGANDSRQIILRKNKNK